MSGGGTAGILRELHELETLRAAALAGKVVVIDPGHGGADLGARPRRAHRGRRRRRPRDPRRGSARRDRRPGAPHPRPRPTPPRAPDEAERAAFANDTAADLVALAARRLGRARRGRRGARRTTTATPRRAPARPSASDFAEMVQDEICARTDLADCRTHAKTWDLLRMTRMPAVRVEFGYLTNPRDAARLDGPGVPRHRRRGHRRGRGALLRARARRGLTRRAGAAARHRYGAQGPSPSSLSPARSPDA